MAGPVLSMGLSLQMRPEGRQVQRLEHRLDFTQEHPLLELMAFWERAKPQKMSLTDTRSGKTVEVEYVFVPKRLMDYVKEGEPYGIYVGDMIFISDRTPLKFAPIVAFKLFEERFIDPGLDESGRAKHLRAALDSVRLASIASFTQSEMKEFVDVLIRTDPSGIIAADPLIQKYAGVPSWQVPEKAAYLDAHSANWRIRNSKAFGGLLAHTEQGQDHFRDFQVCKADILLSRIEHVNPYLLGHFIRRASTIPLGVPFEVDRDLSGPAYALTEESCGFDLIRFIDTGRKVVGSNDVMRSKTERQTESTWRSLVIRVESGLLHLERGIDVRSKAIEGSIASMTAELDRTREKVQGLLSAGGEKPSQEALAGIIPLSRSAAELMSKAQKAFQDLGTELSILDELKKAVGL